MKTIRMQNKYCEICGQAIPNAPSAQKYCHTCKKKLDGVHSRAEREMMKIKIKNEKRSSMTLDEIMREANKEGLQYAAYCKKHGLY